MEKIIKLTRIIVDNDLNPREGALDQAAVLEYSQALDDLPPMHVFEVPGEEGYVLAAGFHRFAAHQLAGVDEADFVVHYGSREKAAEFADLDNLRHGLRLTRKERRKVIERQLKRHPDWADSRLALTLGTTDKTVRTVREELEATSEIPRLDVLVGADGISRPRTVERARPPEVEPGPELPGVGQEEAWEEEAKPDWLEPTSEEGPDVLTPPQPQPPLSPPQGWGGEKSAASPSPLAPKPAPPPPPPPPALTPKPPAPAAWGLTVTIKPGGANGRGDWPTLITLLEGQQIRDTANGTYETLFSDIEALCKAHIEQPQEAG